MIVRGHPELFTISRGYIVYRSERGSRADVRYFTNVVYDAFRYGVVTNQNVQWTLFKGAGSDNKTTTLCTLLTMLTSLDNPLR